ncbi:MAG: tyrosine-type recombinase/integrase [Burkholderiales bacterium]
MRSTVLAMAFPIMDLFGNIFDHPARMGYYLGDLESTSKSHSMTMTAGDMTKEIVGQKSIPLSAESAWQSLERALERFDPRKATEFAERSTSGQTRRAYNRVVREFFSSIGNPDPTRVEPRQVQEWRDKLKAKRQKPATISFKLSVLRAFFAYLVALKLVEKNPADAKLVIPPALPEKMAGQVLTPGEVQELLAGPDKRKAEGARDYALMLAMLRLGLRVSEVASLRSSDIHWSHGRWIIKFKVKGGRERALPLPDDVRLAIKDYIKLDESRRRNLHSDGQEAYLFQPITNYRTLEFDRPLSTRMIQNIVARWGSCCDKKNLSPHDLRRTAITRALDQGLSYRQVQMMSGHRDPKTVMRYDHHRENIDLNAVNFLNYDEQA